LINKVEYRGGDNRACRACNAYKRNGCKFQRVEIKNERANNDQCKHKSKVQGRQREAEGEFVEGKKKKASKQRVDEIVLNEIKRSFLKRRLELFVKNGACATQNRID
jgi:hypothetical protein